MKGAIPDKLIFFAPIIKSRFLNESEAEDDGCYSAAVGVTRHHTDLKISGKYYKHA